MSDNLFAQLGIPQILYGQISPAPIIVNDWVITVEDIEGGKRLVARRGSEIQMMEIMDGAKGDQGDPGYTPQKGVDYFDGEDGVGIVSVEQTATSNADGGFNEILVTLSNGQRSTFRVRNGTKGDQGDPGYTPQKGIDYFDGEDGVDIVSVEQTTTSNVDGGFNTVTVTLSNGKKSTFQVKNGAKGDPGKDGQGAPAATDDEIIDVLVELGLLPGLFDESGAIMTDENGAILLV